MKVVCLGSGNVATHLACAFKSSGATLLQVYSKTLANAQALANVLNSTATDNLKVVDPNADLYVICVKDDAILAVAQELQAFNGIIVHTSGATDINVLKEAGLKNYGVMYPLQTFSKSRELAGSQIPFCLEASRIEVLNDLKTIAGKLSPMLYEVNSEKRKQLHLAAVFACNFTNHLYARSAEILNQHQMDFELLKPLIMETAAKVQTALPKDVQTGPAIRNDKLTMQKHVELLKDNPELVEIYETLSKSIKKTYL
jgi:predicted short-subunit dehydrogenase-like oxidoreductase (DUF2520 family)